LRFGFRFLRALAIAAASLLLVAPLGATSTHHAASANSKTHKSSSKSGKSSSKSSKLKKKSGKSAAHGQKGIDQERTRQIQEALIRQNYMSGEPTGKWDQSTKDALMKFQEANGWQTKTVPDSRALIKLGLGPDKTGLLNPDTAAVSPHELANAQDSRPGGSTQPQQK
jgi:hypothetical protein